MLVKMNPLEDQKQVHAGAFDLGALWFEGTPIRAVGEADYWQEPPCCSSRKIKSGRKTRIHLEGLARTAHPPGQRELPQVRWMQP